jgi:hypothetical protein
MNGNKNRTRKDYSFRGSKVCVVYDLCGRIDHRPGLCGGCNQLHTMRRRQVLVQLSDGLKVRCVQRRLDHQRWRKCGREHMHRVCAGQVLSCIEGVKRTKQ